MSEKNTQSWLPTFELMVIGVFCICFLIWATSKCSATKAQYAEEIPAVEETPPTADQATAETTETATATTAETTDKPPKAEKAPEKPKKEPRLVRERYVPLYVTMDGLNVRTGPSLDSSIVATLPLFEEVGFMNEKTEFKQRISLGKVEANEPWVKIRTRKNKIGWVYGAGVNYYKEKRAGVQ